MKLTDTAPQNVAFPDFMREGWLEETLAELDRARLTPEERAHWEMTIVGNMSMVAAHKEEVRQAVEQAREEATKATEARVKAETEARVKAETKRQAIEKLLSLETLSVSQIAQVQDVSEQFVLSVQEEKDKREKR